MSLSLSECLFCLYVCLLVCLVSVFLSSSSIYPHPPILSFVPHFLSSFPTFHPFYSFSHYTHTHPLIPPLSLLFSLSSYFTLFPLFPSLSLFPFPPPPFPVTRHAGKQACRSPPPSTQAQEADGGIFVYTWLRRAEGGVSHMTPIQMRSTFIFPCRFLYLLCPYLYIYLDIYMRTYAHTYIHAEVHTYIHTYVFFFLFVCRVCVCVSVYMCVSLRACVFMRRDSNFRSHDTASRAKTFRTFRPTPRIRRGRLVEA